MEETQTGFHSLPLNPAVLAALDRVGYVQPTPIQAALIPEALSGRDVIGQAQTGTGKTASFLIPFMNGWRDSNEPGPQALVLAPTRELVVQVCEEAVKLSPSPNFRALPIYGGARLGKQMAELRRGCNLVVGTPGRLLDHLARGTLSLNRVRYVVLDEADRMLDIGFRPDIERILRRCPAQRQTLLLSATVPPPVLRLSERYMVDPTHVNITPEQPTVDKIRQSYVSVEEDRKFELLVKVLEREEPRQAIIFVQRKRSATELYMKLREVRKRVSVMHGDLPQNHRDRIMQRFREGRIVVLVATDVVGRGIDVTNISHVINYDVPEDPEAYVHRIGRTGRIGADGIAIAFVAPEQGKQLTAIECFINKMIEKQEIPGFEAVVLREEPPKPEEPKPVVPVYGRRVKKYSNRP
jgi:ATP-dependent RNA helicase DeaD